MKPVLLRLARVAALLAFGMLFDIGSSTEAHAQTHGMDEGRTRFGRGIDLFKEGNFHAALAEFRAAYVAAPSFRIHYNLGQTLYQLQDYAGAMRSFEQYISEGADKVEPDRKRDVETDLAKLRTRVARLTFVVNVASAEVSVDDEPRGKPLAQGLLVSAGRRRISVTASGYQTEARVLDFAGAQQMELSFELKPVSSLSLRPNEPAAAGAASVVMVTKSRTPFYVGLAATLALGGGTAAMAIVASRDHADYEKALGTPNDPVGFSDARRATRTTALAADVLGGATVLAAGLTIAAYVLTSGVEAERPAPREAKVTSKTSWRPVAGPTSVGVVGTF